MPSNEQPKTLSDYTPSEWKRGKVIKSTNLNNIENQIDTLTDQVLNIDNRLVDFVGANSTTDGVKGVVPAPRAGDENKYLKGDGSWETPAAKHGTSTGAIAEGIDTEASGEGSHAEGQGTIANHSAQHVFGAYNIAESSTGNASEKGTYIEIVGNGTSESERANARTLDWEGNEILAGGITATSFTGSGAGLTNISGTEVGLATSSAAGAMSSADKVKLDELPTNTQLQTNYVSKSSVSDASGIPNADTTQYGLVKIGSNINVDNGTISIPLATSSVSGIVSVGNGLSVDNGIISNNLNIKNGTGDYSIIEGAITGAHLNTASGPYSHAEGQATLAYGSHSHAEGYGSKTNGATSHAEGGHTETTAAYAHSEGYSTKASGWESHAEGNYTIANHKAQHVFGEYNIEDSSDAEISSRGNYIEIVGNGTGSTTSERSNARTLDWTGNEWLAGSISASNFKLNNYDISFGVGETLWTATDASQFEGNTIMLSGENKNNYDFYVVSFRYKYETTFKILFNPGRLHTNIDEIRRESFTSNGVFEHAYRRNIIVARSGNSIYIGDCIRYNYTDLNNGTIENTVLIPLSVIGYYLGRAISSFPS